MTPTAWKKLALALPEAVQKSHFLQPDFRVKGKIFATLNRDETLGTLKLSPTRQAELRERSAAFSPAAGHWGRVGWTHVALDAVSSKEVAPLMLEAWASVAPKTLPTGTPKSVTARAGRKRSPAR